MNFLGIDPDLSTLAVAVVRADMTIVRVWVLRAESVMDMIQELAYRMPESMDMSAFAVESQELYLGKTPNARDILHLAQVAGASMASCFKIHTGGSVSGYFPRPAEWKGQQDKLPHHIRILAKAGITQYRVMGGSAPAPGSHKPDNRYAVPVPPEQITGGKDLNDGDWKHVNDAIGLAQWAAEKYKYEQDKAVALAAARTSTHN